MIKAILFLTVFSIAFYGCKHKENHDGHDHETAEEHAAHSEAETPSAHSDEIIFTKVQAAKTDFEVQEVQPAPFNQVIKATGQILPAQGDEAVIVATGNGIVSFSTAKLTEGVAVNRGQTLFTIVSKNMAEGDYYTKIVAAYQKAKSEYTRAETLVKDRIVSQKEFENAKLNYENAKVAYDAVSHNRTTGGVGITSPLSGYLKNILVREGEYISAGTPLATVSQNKRLVLRADVSEKHYNALKSIGSANFKTPYDNQVYALNDLDGKLLSYGKASEKNSFFIPVTFEFDNKGEIIPGTFVEAYLIATPINNALTVPITALTNEMGLTYVYVQLDDEGYRKQEVVTGANNGKDIQILKGLNPGDRIVTKGAYQVKLAASSGAIPHGHAH